MDIYAPIAHRLGISKIKVELDDLSLKYLKPEVYYDLAEKISLNKEARKAFVNDIVEEVRHHMADAEIASTVDGRVKHFFSIYKKMVKQDKTWIRFTTCSPCGSSWIPSKTATGPWG